MAKKSKGFKLPRHSGWRTAYERLAKAAEVKLRLSKGSGWRDAHEQLAKKLGIKGELPPGAGWMQAFQSLCAEYEAQPVPKEPPTEEVVESDE